MCSNSEILGCHDGLFIRESGKFGKFGELRSVAQRSQRLVVKIGGVAALIAEHTGSEILSVGRIPCKSIFVEKPPGCG